MTRLRADLPTEPTLSLVPYYYPTRQRLCYAYSPTDRTIAPMCLRSNDQSIDELYVQPLSPPDASTVLLPESGNCRAYTPATHRPNDRVCTPTINRPTGRQALCLTTIITVAGTVLPPGQTAAMLAADSDLTVAALPATYRYFTAPACS